MTGNGAPIPVFLINKIKAFDLQPQQATELKKLNANIQICPTVEAFIELLPHAEMVISWRFDQAWYALAPKLKHVYTPAAGHDWVADDPQGNIPATFGTFHGHIMVESLLAMMLWHSRMLRQLDQAKSKERWDRHLLSSTPRLGAGHHFILGYGVIARHCAKVLKALGATITGVKRSERDTQLDHNADFIITPTDLLSQIHQADSIICILPSDNHSSKVLTAKHFSALKPSCHIYNIGRADCYHEDDLINALQNNSLAGAGLDVFATEPLPRRSPLWKLPSVFIMPHAAAIHSEYFELYIEELRQNKVL